MRAQSTEAPRYYVMKVGGYASSDKTGYVSATLVHKGFKACNRLDTTAFKDQARIAFWKYLQANHGFQLSPNEIIPLPTFGTETGEQLRTEVTNYTANERQQGYRVVSTNFTYSCG